MMGFARRGRAFDGDDLSRITRAFDEAWADINGRIGASTPEMEREALLLLADCVLEVAAAPVRDIPSIKSKALARFATRLRPRGGRVVARRPKARSGKRA